MNYRVLDRASEAAANDLAEVRRMIEGMNALVNSQLQQQQLQQQQQQQQQLQQQLEYPTLQQQQDAAALMATIAAVVQQQVSSTEMIPTASIEQLDTESILTTTITHNTESTKTNPAESSPKVAKAEETTSVFLPSTEQTETTATAPVNSNHAPQTGAIIEVTHLTYNRTLYFQLTLEATIEPIIAWLRLSFADSGISGMVLQYKGFDGLWKCLLNRDDSLKRILTQSMKGNVMLQMRVPREQDLLSSGYTDRRLLALTKAD